MLRRPLFPDRLLTISFHLRARTVSASCQTKSAVCRRESRHAKPVDSGVGIVDNQLKNKRVHIDCGNGTADGIACDMGGNLWCGWGMGTEELDGVHIFNTQGKAIGMIHLPERCAIPALAANSVIAC